MAHNVYDVHLADGRAIQVRTPHHHDDHDWNTWVRHMVDLLEQVAVRVAAHEISRVIHRGRL